VWMLPQAEAAKFFIILVFTWLIAAGDFTHIVAGSVEMAVLVWMGDITAATAIGGFFLPVLAGNIVGGTAIFTLMAWGQVRDELPAR
ncbi:MAG: formate/nitrite transporter family protein, partial [Pseudomonadota bacterium]